MWSPARTSPYKFYQYWINVDDADAGKCLRFLTELAHEEIAALDDARGADPGKRESQRRLAESLTELVHGPVGLAAARRATEIFFGAEISDLPEGQLTEIFADVPSKELPRGRLEAVINSALDAIICVDQRQRITVFNPTAAALFQCSASDALGSSLDRFLPDAAQALAFAQLTTQAMLGEMTALTASGKELAVEVSVSFERHAEGETTTWSMAPVE